MSDHEPKDNTGSLFKVANKKSETHADYEGSCIVDGVAYFMNVWMKTPSGKKPFMSFSFKRKDKQPEGAAQPQGGQKQEADDFF